MEADILLRQGTTGGTAKAWSGKREDIRAAQQAFAHRAKMNGLATLGEWKADLESALPELGRPYAWLDVAIGN